MSSLFSLLLAATLLQALSAGRVPHENPQEARSRVGRDYSGYNRSTDTTKLEATKTLLNERFHWDNRDVVPSLSTPLSISVFYQCANFDPSTHVLTSNYWIALSWNDSRLAWSPAEFSGVEHVRVPAYRLWTPDITLYNKIEETSLDNGINAVVDYKGGVTWVPAQTSKTYCRSVGKNQAECKLKLGSWTYPGEILPLTAQHFDGGRDLFDVRGYDEHCPYTLTETTSEIVTKKYDEEHYQSLDIEFTIRKSDIEFIIQDSD